MTNRAIAIGAHPDDVEFLMAGTLALLKEKGWDVSIGILAKGDCGTTSLPRTEITLIRRKEAEAAAAMLGAGIYFMGQSDLAIDVNAEIRRLVTEVIRKASPRVVLTHSPSDYMSDHEFTSRLVRDACFCASVPNYQTEASDPAPALEQLPALFYADPVEGIDIFGDNVVPQFLVDVTSVMNLKRNLLACHASQRDWLRAKHGIDQYLIAMEEWAKRRGEPAGLAYAEGFRQHLGHAFPTENVLKGVLGELVR